MGVYVCDEFTPKLHPNSLWSDLIAIDAFAVSESVGTYAEAALGLPSARERYVRIPIISGALNTCVYFLAQAKV